MAELSTGRLVGRALPHQRPEELEAVLRRKRVTSGTTPSRGHRAWFHIFLARCSGWQRGSARGWLPPGRSKGKCTLTAGLIIQTELAQVTRKTYDVELIGIDDGESADKCRRPPCLVFLQPCASFFRLSVSILSSACVGLSQQTYLCYGVAGARGCLEKIVDGFSYAGALSASGPDDSEKGAARFRQNSGGETEKTGNEQNRDCLPFPASSLAHQPLPLTFQGGDPPASCLAPICPLARRSSHTVETFLPSIHLLALSPCMLPLTASCATFIWRYFCLLPPL